MNINRANRYAFARTLPRKWALLSKSEKAYARYLVEHYGYPVREAMQQAYLTGFYPWSFDYRIGKSVRETRTASSFGF